MNNAKPERAKGLGDTVAKVIHAVTGIDPCEKCKRRRDWLNKRFPYRKPGAKDAPRGEADGGDAKEY